MSCRLKCLVVGFLLVFGLVSLIPAQQIESGSGKPVPDQSFDTTRLVASLHPAQALRWQRTSPGTNSLEGPVLYTIILRSSATPNSIPKIGNNYTLTNSLISESGSTITIAGTANVTGFSMSAGSGTGKVLISDSSGNGTWSTVTTGGIGSGQVVKSLNGLFDTVTLAAGTGISITPSGQTLTIANTALATPAWSLTGNSGTSCTTSPCTDFIGTTDSSSFEVLVNNLRALRIEPQIDVNDSNSSAPNLIGGFSGNAVTGGAVGATIGGGGESGAVITVSANFGTVGGGLRNIVSGQAGTVSGGGGNNATGPYASAGGGGSNTVSGAVATVGGGQNNVASGSFATVPGGIFNTASGLESFAAGNYANTNNQTGAFVWSDATASSAVNATAPNQFIIMAAGGVGIGTTAPATTLDVNGTARMTGFLLPTGAVAAKVLTSDVSGNGTWQSLPAATAWSLTGNSGTSCTTSPCADFVGTTDNSSFEIEVNGSRALRIEPHIDAGDANSPAPNVIGGFSGNTAGGLGSTVAGGGENGFANHANGPFGTVGGGSQNSAGNRGTVAGGNNNTASGGFSAIAGGGGNTASGSSSVVGGGSNNFASNSAVTRVRGQQQQRQRQFLHHRWRQWQLRPRAICNYSGRQQQPSQRHGHLCCWAKYQ